MRKLIEMKTISNTRLLKLDWQLSMYSSTHKLWFKKNWRCHINYATGEVRFKRVAEDTLLSRVALMRDRLRREKNDAQNNVLS